MSSDARTIVFDISAPGPESGRSGVDSSVPETASPSRAPEHVPRPRPSRRSFAAGIALGAALTGGAAGALELGHATAAAEVAPARPDASQHSAVVTGDLTITLSGSQWRFSRSRVTSDPTTGGCAPGTGTYLGSELVPCAPVADVSFAGPAPCP
jgi:hypothetical protein